MPSPSPSVPPASPRGASPPPLSIPLSRAVRLPRSASSHSLSSASSRASRTASASVAPRARSSGSCSSPSSPSGGGASWRKRRSSSCCSGELPQLTAPCISIVAAEPTCHCSAPLPGADAGMHSRARRTLCSCASAGSFARSRCSSCCQRSRFSPQPGLDRKNGPELEAAPGSSVAKAVCQSDGDRRPVALRTHRDVSGSKTSSRRTNASPTTSHAASAKCVTCVASSSRARSSACSSLDASDESRLRSERLRPPPRTSVAAPASLVLVLALAVLALRSLTNNGRQQSHCRQQYMATTRALQRVGKTWQWPCSSGWVRVRCTRLVCRDPQVLHAQV